MRIVKANLLLWMLLSGGTARGVTIETVYVGNKDNVGEWSGESYGGFGANRVCGAVNYNYRIGKYEVTTGQYTEFLNAKATLGDPYSLYSTSMQDYITGYACHIRRTGSGTESSPYVYSVQSSYANLPVNFVGHWGAMRFVNWLHNGQGNGSTETGAYTLNGYTGSDGRWISRNERARWVLPTEDEWYKAAYYDPNKPDGAGYWDYATRSNTAPGQDMADVSGNNANYTPSPSPDCATVVGEFQNSASAYGTYDQNGNVFEMTETAFTQGECARVMRGGAYNLYAYHLTASGRYYLNNPSPFGLSYVGFRVAYIPEPSNIAMLAIGFAGILFWYWCKR